MNQLQHKILFIAAIFFTMSISQVTAEEYTCWLNAPTQSDIWVIVYEANADGDRFEPIYEGKIAAGQRIQIKCDNGHIRYDYTREDGQPYEGDVSRWCDEGNDIQLM